MLIYIKRHPPHFGLAGTCRAQRSRYRNLLANKGFLLSRRCNFQALRRALILLITGFSRTFDFYVTGRLWAGALPLKHFLPSECIYRSFYT